MLFYSIYIKQDIKSCVNGVVCKPAQAVIGGS